MSLPYIVSQRIDFHQLIDGLTEPHYHTLKQIAAQLTELPLSQKCLVFQGTPIHLSDGRMVCEQISPGSQIAEHVRRNRLIA